MGDPVYLRLIGGPRDGQTLVTPGKAFDILELGGHTYRAVHIDEATRTIVYVFHEDDPAAEAGPSSQGQVSG